MRNASRLGFIGFSILALAACGSSDGPAGPAGPPGPAGPAASGAGPSGGAVFPNIGYLGREDDVVITGDATSYDATTTIDMGAGVKVSNVQIVNATTIYAHISIDPTSTIGPHDVIVTQGSTKLTGKGGFKVNATMDATIVGDQAQGGVVDITLADNDRENPFDENSFALTTTFLNLGGQGVNGLSADYIVAIDPVQAPETLQLEGDNQDASGSLLKFFTAPGAMKIVARTPTALTVGTALSTDTFNGPFTTHLYKVSAPAAKTGEFAFQITTGANDPTLPVGILYPASGKGTDLVNFQAAQNPGSVSLPVSTVLTGGAAADFFITLVDQDGTKGNKFTITPMLYDMGGAAYAEVAVGAAAHATKATAEDVTAACATAGVLKPACVINGNISADSETDLYTITLTTATKLHLALIGAGPFDAGPVDPSKILLATDTPDLTEASLFSAGGVEDVYVGSVQGQSANSGDSTASLTTWIIGVAGQEGGGAAGKYSLSVRAIP